jgi:cyclopropane fatty-acyl-phospholipid synthase-like methyltransferase
MSKEKEILEKTYEKPGVVWTETQPPKELAGLVESGKLKPCKAVDLGCGEGFYSIYLASKGFDVTGIDISENAIGYAKENAKKQGVDVTFTVLDVMDLSKLGETFDFALEWALMHLILPPQRGKYAENVSGILKKEAKYLSACFNEKDTHFGEPGQRLRIVPPGGRMPAGTELYFSSMEELRALFTPHFKVIEAEIITMPVGRPHIGNYLFMEKI